MNPSFIHETIAKELNLSLNRVAATVALLDDSNTIPFIARYRKEVTGGLDEVQIRQIRARLDYLRRLAERRAAVKAEIASQGKLTDELAAQLDAAITLQAVEDLYRPYKPKRQTRAQVARERGLEPLAQALLAMAQGAGDKTTPLQLAAQFLNDQIPNTESALAGARDIIAEQMSDDPATRQAVRQAFATDGLVVSQRASDEADPEGRYRVYYDFRAALRAVQPHQWLALQRGAGDGSLKVRIETPDGDIAADLAARWIKIPCNPAAGQVRLAIEDGYDRLLRPSVEREVSGQLSDYADDHAITVFAANLRNLLLQPPLRERAVLGIDPGFRTGCKVATVDPTGKLLHTATIYPHEPRNEREKALQILAGLVELDKISVIAIGNGTASRETEALVAELIQTFPQTFEVSQTSKVSHLTSPQTFEVSQTSKVSHQTFPQTFEVSQTSKVSHLTSPQTFEVSQTSKVSHLAYVIVSEAGASVYSASGIAREEFPDLDVSMRGAVSIARRLQDPLAELVKIAPQSIGVGLYQHDVDQKKLAATLDAVVESVVNYVGVDVNTASAALLGYVSGISKKVAAAIVEYRNENGPFRSRAELKKVKGLGPKGFEQAAGFLRVPESRNPLDNTTIHPESYDAAKALLGLADLNLRMADLPNRLRKWCEENNLTPPAPLPWQGRGEAGFPPLPELALSVRLSAHAEGSSKGEGSGERSTWHAIAELLGIGEPTLRDIVDALLRPGRDPRDNLPPVVFRRDVLTIDDLREGMVLRGPSEMW